MADTLDLLSINAAKAAINMPVTVVEHDTVLARHITAISRIIDDSCGPVVQRTITAERHAGGRHRIELRRHPVTSISLVREARMGTIETLTEVGFGETADGYEAPVWPRDPALLSGVLYRRRFGTEFTWWPGSGTVEVTYVAGRVAATADVDARFADACGAILRRLWKRESGSWAQTPQFYEDNDATAGSGFFRVAAPIIEELLWDEMQNHLIAIR